MKYYLVAGEKSGDLHASNLMKELKLLDNQADFRFFGGDKMQEVGGQRFRHYKDAAIIGFVEVVMKMRTVKENIRTTQEDIANYNPDVLILIDYGGFNMRMAKFAHEKGIKIYYYITPKVWAWNQKRAWKIKAYVDKAFCILPFEKEFFERYDFNVDYVGNPVLDVVGDFVPDEDFRTKNNLHPSKPLLAVLPGSRRNEIKNMLPTMLEVFDKYPQYHPVIAGVNQFSPEFYAQFIGDRDIKVLYEETFDILNLSEMAIVTSGTATLETGLFNVPQVVCYAGNRLSYEIAKRLVKIKYISLVNLICDKPVIKEFIQVDFTKQNLENEMNNIANDEAYREQIQSDYTHMKQLLGGEGASRKTARLMVDYLASSETE